MTDCSITNWRTANKDVSKTRFVYCKLFTIYTRYGKQLQDFSQTTGQGPKSAITTVVCQWSISGFKIVNLFIGDYQTCLTPLQQQSKAQVLHAHYGKCKVFLDRKLQKDSCLRVFRLPIFIKLMWGMDFENAFENCRVVSSNEFWWIIL